LVLVVVVWIRFRVQFPAEEMIMLVGSSTEGQEDVVVVGVGKVAKGCHSVNGEEEILKQENLCTGFGNERRSAWDESG
jgi:hypothetical protein